MSLHLEQKLPQQETVSLPNICCFALRVYYIFIAVASSGGDDVRELGFMGKMGCDS